MSRVRLMVLVFLDDIETVGLTILVGSIASSMKFEHRNWY
jgi:hypothetical protein